MSDAVSLHFLATVPGERLPQKMFTLDVDRFILARATGHYFSALYSGRFGEHGHGGPMREISLLDVLPHDVLSQEAVRAFFDLVGLLTHRALSSDNANEPSTRLRQQLMEHQGQVIQAASTNILAIHALAEYFGAPRISRWVYGQLPRIMDDDVAHAVLDYCLMPTGPGQLAAVRPMARHLYALALMWARCLRPCGPRSSLDTRLEALHTQVEARDGYDIFHPPRPSPHMGGPESSGITFHGCMIKCMDCCDYTTSSVKRTELLPSAVVTDEGHWSAVLEEERTATGSRTLTLRRMPTPLVRELVRRHPRFGISPEQTHQVNPKQAYILEHLAALAPQVDHPEFQLEKRTFECSVSMCFVRKASRAAATMDDMASTVAFSDLCAERVAVPLPASASPVTGPSSLWCCKITLPAHCRPTDYYDGICQVCRTQKPVSILAYRIAIKSRGSPTGGGEDDNSDSEPNTCSTESDESIPEDDLMDISQ